MSKTIFIQLTTSSTKIGPFKTYDDRGNVLGTNVSRSTLISGVTYIVDDDVQVITIESTGKCKVKQNFSISTITPSERASLEFTVSKTACLWRHLTDVTKYNYFYGVVEPYIIEYPFAYQYYDEILQNVKDYTKAYQYFTDNTGVFNDNNRIQPDNLWFNKAVLYNDQQSSGTLELVAKPMNNLSQYLKYPIYNAQSKTITYTKSDNFYQYNTFWSLVKDKRVPLFTNTCESLSIDKIVNQSNMDYSKRSFKKEPLRAKDLKVRHILDNRSDIHLVSQFIITPTQISYK
jgi:hypothetical protein